MDNYYFCGEVNICTKIPLEHCSVPARPEFSLQPEKAQPNPI